LVSVIGSDLVYELVFLDPSLDLPVGSDGVFALSHFYIVTLKT